MRKTNCWEHKKCGREPGGHKVAQLGVCPATREVRLHQTHGGRNGGRACWIVAGSLCGGEVQGTFAQKFKNCSSCDFYLQVRKEEQFEFELSAVLLAKIATLGNRRRAGGQGPAVREEGDDLPAIKARRNWWQAVEKVV